MADLTNENVYNLGGGILQPAMEYNFRVLFAVGSTEFPILSSQVVSVKYDIVSSTGTMIIECPVKGGVEQALEIVCGTNQFVPDVRVEQLNGSTTDACYAVEFVEFNATSCVIEHDFTKRGALTATVKFEFTKTSSFTT